MLGLSIVAQGLKEQSYPKERTGIAGQWGIIVWGDQMYPKKSIYLENREKAKWDKLNIKMLRSLNIKTETRLSETEMLPGASLLIKVSFWYS